MSLGDLPFNPLGGQPAFLPADLERFVAAAHADCTLGEIAGVLREVFGEDKEPKIL